MIVHELAILWVEVKDAGRMELVNLGRSDTYIPPDVRLLEDLRDPLSEVGSLEVGTMLVREKRPRGPSSCSSSIPHISWCTDICGV